MTDHGKPDREILLRDEHWRERKLREAKAWLAMRKEERARLGERAVYRTVRMTVPCK